MGEMGLQGSSDGLDLVGSSADGAEGHHELASGDSYQFTALC